MRTSFRFILALGLPLAILAACGTDRESGSPLDTSLDLTGVAADCPAGDISADIQAIFPTGASLRHVATVNCGQIYKDLGKGKQTQAIQKAFKFFQKTLQQNEDGQLLDADPSTEEKIIDLFAAIFTDLGFDFPDIDPEVLAEGEYAFGTLKPNGPPLLTVSGHAGIDDGGGLLGPVQALIVKIGPAENSDLNVSSESHPCPAGVDNSFDCYPLFFDYSVVPESNVNPAVGLQLGQCNVSPEGVDVLLLSPEGFLPEDDAPTGVVCTDVEPEETAMTGWRSYAWAVLEPMSPLFRVSKAFAGKSPIGGRISAFSPVAPADPESGGEETLGSISGQVFDNSTEGSIPGATVELFTSDEELVGTTTTNSDGNYFFSELDLGDYIVEAEAEGYSPGSSDPVALTEESPDADNVNIGLDPDEIATLTSLSPDDANMVSTSGEGDTQVFMANVNELLTEQSVNEGVVLFSVEGTEFFDSVEVPVVEGQAEFDVGCNTETYGDIMVFFGEYTVHAEYQGTDVYGSSSEPEPSTLSCDEVFAE
jgi:hypothetical protein